MSYKIYINGNTFYIEDTTVPNKLYEGHAKDVLLRRGDLTSQIISFNNVNNWDRTRTIDFATEVDLTGAPYTDFATFVAWTETNLGKSSPEAAGLQTGGAHYIDTQYTDISPFDIPANSTGTTIPCNNGQIIDGNLPTEFTNGMFFNNKLQAVNDKDRFVTEIRFKAKISVVSGKFSMFIDIGSGSIINIRDEGFLFSKGANEEQEFAACIHYYTGTTFIANGGAVKIKNNNGILSLYDIQILPTRVHKGF